MAPKPSVEKLTRKGMQAAKAGDWRGACAAFAEILDHFPKNQRARKALDALKPQALPALLKQAETSQRQSAWAEAEADLRAASLLAPEMSEVALALGACQLEMGAAPAALATAKRLLSRFPDHSGALNLKGRAEREMGRLAESRQTLEQALDLDPQDAQTLNNLATTARAAGRGEDAVSFYQQALALAPQSMTLHNNFAQVYKYEKDDEHLATMLSLAQGREKDETAAPLFFALFKALSDQGDYASAFTHLQRANQLARAAGGYDFQSDALPFALIKNILTDPVTVPGRADFEPRPVFVTGLPRTGTSLVERMLARDPQVQPGGELTVVQLAVSRLLRRLMDRSDKSLQNDDIADLRREFTEGLSSYSDGRPVIIDKMPLNFRWIGFILAALPEARVVHLDRDPMAVAWSLYRLDFAGAGHRFIYDAGDIARFMVLHGEYMAHWQAVFPGRIYNLKYEDLVAGPEEQGKALAQATGLTWTEDWLSPEAGDSPTLTASFDQVRRPIYRDSNAAWHRFEAELEPMRKTLDAAGLLP